MSKALLPSFILRIGIGRTIFTEEYACITKDNNFEVVHWSDSIDIYYIGFDRVYHVYIGNHSNWKWVDPVAISPNNAEGGITAVRKNNAINVFYLNDIGDVVHYYIGERTGNKWDKYRTDYK